MDEVSSETRVTLVNYVAGTPIIVDGLVVGALSDDCTKLDVTLRKLRELWVCSPCNTVEWRNSHFGITVNCDHAIIYLPDKPTQNPGGPDESPERPPKGGGDNAGTPRPGSGVFSDYGGDLPPPDPGASSGTGGRDQPWEGWGGRVAVALNPLGYPDSITGSDGTVKPNGDLGKREPYFGTLLDAVNTLSSAAGGRPVVLKQVPLPDGAVAYPGTNQAWFYDKGTGAVILWYQPVDPQSGFDLKTSGNTVSGVIEVPQGTESSQSDNRAGHNGVASPGSVDTSGGDSSVAAEQDREEMTGIPGNTGWSSSDPGIPYNPGGHPTE